jgi:hypothetical protein
MCPATVCNEPGEEHRILVQIINEESVFSRWKVHIDEKGQISVIGFLGGREKGLEFAGLFGKPVCLGPLNAIWLEGFRGIALPFVKTFVIIVCCYHAYDKSQPRQHEK